MSHVNVIRAWKASQPSSLKRRSKERKNLRKKAIVVAFSVATLISWSARLDTAIAAFERRPKVCSQAEAGCQTACPYWDGVATTCAASGYECETGPIEPPPPISG